MTTSLYLYRTGDGNEGNYPRFILELSEGQCPYAALDALAACDHIPGSRTRRHIMREMWTDGEPLYGIQGTVYEGPSGERAFGAAWLTCELEPYSEEDAYLSTLRRWTLRETLDDAAWRFYRKRAARA